MHAPNGLARAAVRFRPAAFGGTFVALLLTVAVVSACGILLQTGLRAGPAPQRYAAAPVVVAADQHVTQRVGRGDGAYDLTAAVPDRARIPAALAATLTRRLAPLAQAVPDVTFPVRTPAGPATASGWSATALVPAPLTTGRAPQRGEVVLGPATAGAATAAVGERVRLDTPAGVRELTVAGHTAAAGVWLADADAGALSGHPDALDALALLPSPGTDTAALAAAARTAVADAGGHARVLTGDARALDPRLDAAKQLLTALGGSFGGIAAMVAVFTAAATVALAVGQRSREFALLRAVGATPRQIRRTVATEALIVAPPAGVVGCLPGTALAAWWFDRLKDKGAIPAGVELSLGWIPYACALGLGLVTALLAGLAAARRPARIRPGQALAAAAVERLRPGWIRTPLGFAALAGGASFAGLAASGGGEDAANAALGVVMLFMLAVALLGPLIARACTALLGLPLRGAAAPGALAAANSRANARRLASALTPIVLATAFSSTLLFLHTSEDRATARQQAAGLTADHVVVGAGGSPLPTDAAARAAAVPGVTAAVAVTRTSVLVAHGAGEGRTLRSASAQAVSGDPSRVQDLGVRQGGLDRLGPGTVAVDRLLAETAGLAPGDRLELWLPDGTPVRPEVVAVYTRGLGFGEITLPARDLAGHTTSGAPTELLVQGASPAPAGIGTVTDAAGLNAARAVDREVNAWANTTMAAVLGGFAAVAAANTLVMTVADRRQELRMLRLIGTTRRQVLRMVRWEALLIACSGLALGAAIALATLLPMTRALTGEAPHLPPLLCGSLVAGVLALALTATSLPARRALRPAGS
ncbi:ABC transporter permease [Streptomyces antimicrobicus]|uniref:FtsX-like permease family protein n=1 Tax=Streptomyces antimicrobicus TaxID=2883108 RepID=A0ABS8B0S9_9ACTN|nr:ABC transporter permease [Streptomyces antimicrobicus]MCB5178211.1 FtsX-like permease family protein [Streptomyces antimicrobicus]